mmetsp:Transcript_30764/g.56821  ORF Transcript_30764/g.56821 Transcript_30764/m.56821 type:complete len:235 (+) Transcript_30764:147-851(+)
MGQNGTKCCCGVHRGQQPIQVINSAGEKGEPAAPKVPQGANQTQGAADAPMAVKSITAAMNNAQVEERDFDLQSEGGQSNHSRASSAASSAYAEMSKEQRTAAKNIIKDFVKTMVKGKQIHVVLPNGNIRVCFVALSRKLDTLKIKANEKDKQSRNIALANIEEIVVGQDTGEIAAFEGLETPLDEMSVTLALQSSECITFRMPDPDSRDTLVMCLTMFSNEARAKQEQDLGSC